MAICGKPSLSGEPCGWKSGPCPHHGTPRASRPRPGSAPAPRRAPEAPPRELHAFSWWVIDGVLDKTIEPPQGQALAAVGRLLASLGPEPVDADAALAVAVLRGRVMHGLVPEDDEGWAFASAVFLPDAIDEMRSWAGLLERDPVHHRQPHRFVDPATLEGDVPLGGEIEDGVWGDL